MQTFESLNCTPILWMQLMDLWPHYFTAKGTCPLFFSSKSFPSLHSRSFWGWFWVTSQWLYAQQQQLCYKPGIKTKLDTRVPPHLRHQCPIITSSLSVSLPSHLRGLNKPWVGNGTNGQYRLHAVIWAVLTLILAFYSAALQGQGGSWNSRSQSMQVLDTGNELAFSHPRVFY